MGSLFSKSGLPKLSEITGVRQAAQHQSPATLDLMLDMFAYQVKELQTH